MNELTVRDVGDYWDTVEGVGNYFRHLAPKEEDQVRQVLDDTVGRAVKRKSFTTARLFTRLSRLLEE